MSLKANRKRLTGPPHPDRDCQFRYISKQKKLFFQNNLPVISVDTKHKELIGNFKNPGRTWIREPIEVNAHDFPQDALCKAAPYGVYDVGRNHGFVHVGVSSDTPQFAVDSIPPTSSLGSFNSYFRTPENLNLDTNMTII